MPPFQTDAHAASPPDDLAQVRILFPAPLNLGPGKIRLLAAIRDKGSISGAARTLKISYRRAWQMADSLNRVFSTPLIDCAAGGVRGGGTRLTPLGETVLAHYNRMQAKAAAAIAEEARAFLRLNEPPAQSP